MQEAVSRAVFLLSTPHGALGTIMEAVSMALHKRLSTPHGALGTLLRLFLLPTFPLLSTPHGALGTLELYRQNPNLFTFQLHTVH